MKAIRAIIGFFDALWTFLILIPFCLIMAKLNGEYDEHETPSSIAFDVIGMLVMTIGVLFVIALSLWALFAWG